MPIKKDKYPLGLLIGIEPLLKVFKQYEFEYMDIIEKEKKVPWSWPKKLVYLSFRPKNKDLHFYFKVTGIQRDEGLKYSFKYYPCGYNDMSSHSYAEQLSTIQYTFESWVHLVKQYNNVKLTEKEIFVDKYSSEFAEEFKILDEDAKTMPFNNNQQVFVYNLLDYLKHELKKSENPDPQITEIVNDINLVQNNLPSLTKSSTITSLSRIFAKIKTVGLNLLIDIIDVAKKEIIKKALYGGLEEIGTIFHHLH